MLRTIRKLAKVLDVKVEELTSNWVTIGVDNPHEPHVEADNER